MRKTKRFTPTVIARFIREGRGTGTHSDYIPWHKVSRGDPSSHGRSHLLNWRNRLRELLSDGELGEQLFAIMLPDVEDSLEQFPLALDSHRHPLAAYTGRSSDDLFPGTEQLAAELGIRHPVVRDKGEVAQWTATTDLVLVFKGPSHTFTMLAIAFKPRGWDSSARTKQLLRLEREYWVRLQVPWLLITPDEYDKRTVLTLRRTGCWALTDEVTQDQQEWAAQAARECSHLSLTSLLHGMAKHLGSLPTAQRALWQSIWSGRLPVDLRMGWRPHLPLRHISAEAFKQLNPLASRRSSWI